MAQVQKTGVWNRWLQENVAVYRRNATTTRDYRVQLRSNKAILLWSVYLLVLIGFGMLTYSVAAGSEMSVVEAQARLHTFYESVTGLLATMIALVAPALTATAIVSERQRKSLDLVFSAPVSPKYYLVGKMLSSYRYIWMLLVLSLPVTAACVVLGGASWSEVLAGYGLMSLQGLIYTSIALLFSTLAQRPVGAVVWSYIGVFAYGLLMGYLGNGMAAATVYGHSPSSSEMPFVVCLSPYSVFSVSLSYTVVLGYHVPNWLLASFFTLAVVKLMLVGAGSALSPYGSAETKSLRVHGLIYMFLVALGLSAITASTLGALGSVGASTGPSSNYELYYSRLFLGLVMPLLILTPFISCFGVDLEKKYWPDGIFQPSRLLTGTPSGGLPYLLSLVLAAAAGVALYGLWLPQILGFSFIAYVFYAMSLMAAIWSLGRLSSAQNNGLRYARTLQFTGIVLFLGLPPAFISLVDPFGNVSLQPGYNLWDFYILRPLFSSSDRTALTAGFGLLLSIAAFAVASLSEGVAKRRYLRAGLEYGSA